MHYLIDDVGEELWSGGVCLAPDIHEQIRKFTDVKWYRDQRMNFTLVIKGGAHVAKAAECESSVLLAPQPRPHDLPPQALFTPAFEARARCAWQ
jgi:hypothetical protein